MVVGVVAALLSAVCYGVAGVLQARAARTTASTPGLDVRLFLRLSRRAPFLAGILLDAIGFAAQFTALRRLPVFVVQAAQASSLAVMAVVAVPVLGVRLGARQWLAVGAVCTGLTMLAGTAGPQGVATGAGVVHWILLGAAMGLSAASFAAGRLTGAARSPLLGLLSGLGFGVVALAARALTGLSPGQVLRDPATYALVGGGAVAFLCYATALQHGAVTSTTSAVILGETLVPAVVGILVFGDHTRAGGAPTAVGGFALAVAGAIALSSTVESPRTTD